MFFRDLAKTLFYSIVIFYTHREAWLQQGFWNHYVSTGNPVELSEAANKNIIYLCLFQIYEDLHFHIEVIFGKYLMIKGKNTVDGLGLGDVLDKLKNYNLISNNSDFSNGCKIVRYTRNSIHSKMGMYIFAFPGEDVFYNNKVYSFKNGEYVSVSYEFLEKFVWDLVSVCKGIFS